MYLFPNKVKYARAIFFKLIRKFYSFVIRWRWLSYYKTVSYDLGYCGRNLTLCNGISFGGTGRIFINDNVFIGENVILNAGKGGRIDIIPLMEDIILAEIMNNEVSLDFIIPN